MTFFSHNLAVYCLQLAALGGAALLAAWVLRLRAPRFAWRFWQLVMLAALALPLMQPHADKGSLHIVRGGAILAGSPSEAFVAQIATDWSAIILTIVVCGVVIRLAWLFIGIVRIRTLIATAVPSHAIAPLFEELNQSLGTRAAALISDALEGPATVGVLKPVVMLPRSVLEMPAAVQRAIICHELVHVRRRDWIHTIVEEVWCAMLWFHPAARLIASRVSLARETVVDEITILLTRDRRAYAEALLAFSDPQPHLIGVTPFIGRRTLSRRISLIAAESSRSRRALASLVLALAASSSLTAAAVARFPMSGADQFEMVYSLGPGSGITLPHVVREVKPSYTAPAMQNKIQGSVWLSCVVDTRGEIVDVQVTRSLDPQFGLDREAIKAATQWKFVPAEKDGKPVAVRITIELTFTLR
jgi:TonB family protein